MKLQKHDGYAYNITVILQFHPVIITRADQVKSFCYIIYIYIFLNLINVYIFRKKFEL